MYAIDFNSNDLQKIGTLSNIDKLEELGKINYEKNIEIMEYPFKFNEMFLNIN